MTTSRSSSRGDPPGYEVDALYNTCSNERINLHLLPNGSTSVVTLVRQLYYDDQKQAGK
jgi:hypothetical protein